MSQKVQILNQHLELRLKFNHSSSINLVLYPTVTVGHEFFAKLQQKWKLQAGKHSFLPTVQARRFRQVFPLFLPPKQPLSYLFQP